MKTQTAILIFGCIPAMAQSDGNFLGVNVRDPAKEAAAQERQKQLADEEYRSFIPKDPWRQIDGQPNYAKGDGWDGFDGKVLEVQPNGIRIEGKRVRPGTGEILHTENGEMTYKGYGAFSHQEEFFVEHYPYQCTESENISLRENLTAKEDGVFTYQTVLGGSRTIPKLDYGVPCNPPPPTPEQLAAMKLKHELDKKRELEAQTNAVHALQSLATNGDASAQFSLGLHYLNGRGCETNKEQAIYWLEKAAAQGDLEASNKLSKLR